MKMISRIVLLVVGCMSGSLRDVSVRR